MHVFIMAHRVSYLRRRMSRVCDLLISPVVTGSASHNEVRRMTDPCHFPDYRFALNDLLLNSFLSGLKM